MNTNNKHYEILAIEPWEIMERNFNTEEFVAYLKGNIIKYTLRDKGQALTDAQKIKHYAEKLIEVLETKENDKDNWTITGVEPEEVEDKHKFKVGDRVRVILHNETGTIIRLPKEGLRDVDKGNYIIELDEGYAGWKANVGDHAVKSERAWYADDNGLELLKEEPKKILKPYKWYDATNFTVEELKEMLPVGTTVLVTEHHDNDRAVDLEEEETKLAEITNIGQRWRSKDTRVGVKGDCLWRRYFKIEEE